MYRNFIPVDRPAGHGARNIRFLFLPCLTGSANIKNVDPVSVKEDAPIFAKMPTEQELRRKEHVSSQPSSSIHIFLNDSIRIEICPSCPSELLSAIIKELRYHA